MIRIVSVKVVDKFRVCLGLTNGKQKTVDLEPYLQGPIFEPIRNDSKLFKTVHVDTELGTIVWDNGADIDPDVLIEGLTPARMETQYHYSEDTRHAVAVREKKAGYLGRKKG